MKKLLPILLCLLGLQTSAQLWSGYTQKDTVILSRNITITYVTGKTDSTNAFLNMNGLGEVGSNVALNYVYGPHYWLTHGWDGGIVLGNGTHYPLYVTIQPNSGFYPPSFLKLIVDVLKTRFKIREGGINAMGLSAGGWSWETYMYYEPTLHDHSYAAMLRTIINLEGLRVDDNSGADPYSWPAYLGHAFKNAPNLRFMAFEQVGDSRAKDTEIKNMIDSAGSSSRVAFFWTNFGSSGHSNFNDMYSPFQTNWTLTNADVQLSNGGVLNTIPIATGQNIWQWALRQDRDTSLVGTNNNPSVDPGPNQTINYPGTTSVTMAGNATDDGTVVSHTWSKISGPSGGNITTPSSYTTTITGLLPGVYVFRLSATDDQGGTGTNDMSVTVNNTGFNAPPDVEAGLSQIIQLPTSSVVLTASATDDSAISRYKVSILKAPTQPVYSIAVIGSSTSTCFNVGGPNGDSCYVRIVKDYFKSIGTIDTVYNLAQSTTTIFEGMQTGYTQPVGYPAPNTSINITAAIAKSGTDIIIVNYPSNGYDYMTVANVMKAIRDMKAYAEGLGKKIYFTTTQQRSGFSPSEEARLIEITDSIRIQIPNNYIQFYWGFQKEGTTDYRADFDAFDGVHGNGKSQLQRAKNVIAFNPIKDLIPGSAVVTNPASNTTSITGLVQGTYLVQVSAQDDDSLWSSDTMSITVNAASSSCNGNSPVTYTIAPTAPNEIYITNAMSKPWKGGDTLKIPAGNYSVIEIDSFGGDPCRDIIIVNSGGQVNVSGSGMRFGKNVHHVKVLGIGSVDTYGFKTNSFAFGRVNHFTVRRVEAGPNPFGVGFYGKQDPYQDEPWTWYPNYTMTKITLDSNYIHDVDGEGMYIGHTYPDGDPAQGNRIPQRLDSVTISNNRVENTGWDGIQLSNARNGNLIYNNTVTNFGILDIDGQRAGIISGGNTRSKVYNNTVTNGKGNGIEFFGYDTLECYNNVITSVGNTTKNVNGEESIYGQAYVNGVELNPKQRMYIHDNQINYPKPLGAIRFNHNNNSETARLIDNKFCFLTTPPANWQSLYIFMQAGYINTNNTLFCEGGTNQAPTVSAGSNVTIQLPTTGAILNGSASDGDGTIVSYLWEEISRPIGALPATISSPTTASTNVTNLTTTGLRTFRLTATDNGGISVASTVTINVTAPINQAPTVSAGSNQTIFLPTNSILLSGTAGDADGTITSILWERVSGPVTNIASPTSLTTTVSGLIQGVYRYRLTVTDNNGAAVSAEVEITVNAQPDGSPTLSPRRSIHIKRAF